jgi:L-amino acid N-acyltransferase YncA
LIDRIVIREVSIQDCEQVYLIRNHPENYKWFFNEVEVTKEEHALWFSFRLMHFSFFTLVAELGNEIVGVAYLKDLELKSPKVSISIKPGSKGEGVGSKLLDELVRRAKLTNIHSILAEIKVLNTPSFNFFVKKGFTDNDQGPEILTHHRLEIITLIFKLT